MYPPELVAPMKGELTEVGFQQLLTSDEVDSVLNNKQGTALVVVNSVCGCAARMARPGLKLALSQSSKKPEKLTTVFAGVDRESTERAREYMLPYPPSSPSIALFKDGKLVHFLERHHIEGRPAELIAENLKAAFNEHC
ncbi:MAG: BrxA/BrxB family bacilliredoxin [Chitinophagales bacterium]|nr:BrxA/BrxB family bacilliredoxin [Chitinophagales bacterium]